MIVILPNGEQGYWIDHAEGGPQRADFVVLEGEHEGWYWKHYLPEYLTFYSAALD